MTRRRERRGDEPAVARRDLRLYRRLFGLARPYRLRLIGILGLGLLAGPLALLTPLPLKIAVDSVLQPGPAPGFLEAAIPGGGPASDPAILVALVVLVLAIALATQVQAFGSWYLQASVGERLVLRFQSQLFRHVQRLSLQYHDRTGTADSVFRIQYDAREIQTLIVGGTIPLLSSLATIAGMIYVAARIDLQLALVAMLVAPVLFVLLRWYRISTRARYGESKRLQSSAVSVVQETLGALRVVKAFGQEDREQDRFVTHSTASVRAKLRLIVAEGLFGVVVGMVVAGASAAMLFLGVSHVRSGVLTLGELLLLMGYLTMLYEPLQSVSKKVAGLQSSFASAERAFALLDQLPDVPEAGHPRPLERAEGHLELRGVSYVYPGDRAHPVLRGVDLDVPAGTSVGIVGVTGAGKSTLVNLLTRFFDPTEGAILLDGIDLREYWLADLRSQFAIVLQEPVLFSASIAENIAYAKPNASMEEIADAARAAGAHDFIQRLPQGYETTVGERGMSLSGGERQRISLARAFLKDAPILILDEPTSALDAGTEARIMDAIERLQAGRTTFVIAHRPRVLEGSDQLLHLEDGRVDLRASGPVVPGAARTTPATGSG